MLICNHTLRQLSNHVIDCVPKWPCAYIFSLYLPESIHKLSRISIVICNSINVCNITFRCVLLFIPWFVSVQVLARVLVSANTRRVTLAILRLRNPVVKTKYIDCQFKSYNNRHLKIFSTPVNTLYTTSLLRHRSVGSISNVHICIL